VRSFDAGGPCERKKFSSACLLISLLLCRMLIAVECCHRFMGSGDWNNVTNWSSGALPGPNDDVVIDRPGAITVTHSAAARRQEHPLSGGVCSLRRLVDGVEHHAGKQWVQDFGRHAGGCHSFAGYQRSGNHREQRHVGWSDGERGFGCGSAGQRGPT